jgi:RNA polymerase sigma-70 factor (ECF subfamily)
MYRIAVAKSLDEIKRQQRKKRVSTAGITSGLDEIAHRLICKDRPDKRLEDKESVGLFFHALNCLPDNQRMAITLSKLDGYSNTEIARKMKTTLTAVDSLIYRAKKNFKLTLMSQLRDISRIQNSESSQSAVFNMVG